MKKVILLIGKAIESSSTVTTTCVLILLAAYIISDAFFAWTSRFNQGTVIDTGKEIAGIGVMAGMIALSYFAVRTLLVIISKRKINIHNSIDSALKTLVTFLRMIHPTAGIIAISLLAAHGYTIFHHELAESIDPLSVSGISAISAGYILLIMGILLFRKRTNTTIRKAHRYIAIVCAIAAIIHITVVSLLA